MRSAAHLHDGQRAALGRPHAADFQRQPVDLRLEDAGQCAVPLRTAPDLAFGPLREGAQFLHLRMLRSDAVDHRQAVRIEHARLGAEMTQKALRLERQQSAERALAQRPVQQQYARRMRRHDGRCELGEIRYIEVCRADVGQVVVGVMHGRCRIRVADKVLGAECISAPATRKKKPSEKRRAH